MNERIEKEEDNLNEKIVNALERYFPKGDKARGRALILHSIAQLEYQELQKAFNIAIEEINRLRKKLGYDIKK